MKIILAASVCLLWLSFLCADSVSAVEFDWTSQALLKLYEKPTTASWTPQCSSYYQPVSIEGRGGKTMACYFGGERARMAVSYPDDGRSRLLISPPYEEQYYEIEGVCERIANCTYNPVADVLIARYEATHLYRSVVVYRDVLSRIRYEVDPLTGVSRFLFDASDPEYRFENEGTPLPVEAVALSNNGKWAAIEYKGYGIVTIDLQSFVTRRIQAPGYRYGWSLDPTVELAVSNDGRLVAVMGENLGLSVIQAEPGCGDTVQRGMGQYFAESVRFCPLSSFDYTSHIKRFHGSYDPYFNDTGNRLDVTLLSKSGAAKRISIGPASHDARLAYLALGDSFTSGEGELEDRFYQPQTNDRYEKCHLSTRSYPYLLGSMVSLSQSRSVACSGAKMTDVFSEGDYEGQGSRLGKSGLNLTRGEFIQWRDYALNTFVPGWAPQGDFVEKYQPDLITVGIGGNDAGLMTKLKVCAMPNECEWVSDEGRRKTAFEIRGMVERFIEFYQKLGNVAPSSRVVAVGYPKVMNESGVCDLVTTLLLNNSERRFMNEGLMLLNRAIERAARHVGVEFADMSEAFDGHELCSGVSRKAMNGVRAGDDGVIGSFLPMRLIGNESFHPTPFGHQLMAAVLSRHEKREVIAQVDDFISEPHEYWGSAEPEVISKHVAFASPEDVSAGQSVTIHLPAQSFSPNSAMRLEIHSEPKELAVLKADQEGALNATVYLPTDTSEGFHTLHLYGTSFTGRDIELYQGIEYRVDPVHTNERSWLSGIPEMINVTGVTKGVVREGVKVAGVLSVVTDKVKNNPSLGVVFLGAYLIGCAVVVIILLRIFSKHSPP